MERTGQFEVERARRELTRKATWKQCRETSGLLSTSLLFSVFLLVVRLMGVGLLILLVITFLSTSVHSLFGYRFGNLLGNR